MNMPRWNPMQMIKNTVPELIRWFGPLGRYVGANIACHTWWSLVWSRSGYNAVYNAVWGMYNAVSVVKF